MTYSEIDQSVLHYEGQEVAKRALESNQKPIPDGDLLASTEVQATMQQYYSQLEKHLSEPQATTQASDIDIEDEEAVNNFIDKQNQQQQWQHDQFIMSQLVDQNMVSNDLTNADQVAPNEEIDNSVLDQPLDEQESIFGDGLDDLSNDNELLR